VVFSTFGGNMTKIRRVGEWMEAIPCSNNHSKVDEFSGLIENIVSDLAIVDVIDFGCGEGDLCKIFGHRGYLGLDIDERCIQRAQSKHFNYRFEKPKEMVYSADLCVASRVFNELNDESIHDLMRRMRCKWLLIADSFSHEKSENTVVPFHSRNRESYINLMRGHDLLQIKQVVKPISQPKPTEISLLLFKKCGRNPNSF
jgi:SAM-dependent methyltransferase